jgi:hypothetical protein
MTHRLNRIARISLSGGIVGLLTTNPRSAIENAVTKANTEGWNCRQILPHSPRNILVFALQLVVLVCTLFIWTWGAGYILLLEKDAN